MKKVKIHDLTPEEQKSLRQLKRLEKQSALLTIQVEAAKKIWWDKLTFDHALPMNWDKVKWVEGKCIYIFE